jgi:nucleoid-associated protein YgaU
VIAVINNLDDPDRIVLGQELEMQYVTFRHRVKAGDTKKSLELYFYNDVAMSEVFEIPNGGSARPDRRGVAAGPDLANVGHHTVIGGEKLPVLSVRWYGEPILWPIIAIANQLSGPDPSPGTVVAGDTLRKPTGDDCGDYDDGRTLTLVMMVAAATLIDDPDFITVGQVIYFPPFELAAR